MSDVEIAGVSFGYRTDPILSDLDLSVRSGELLSLIGPSGCGKTTLLRLLAGFERPREGVISLGGQVVAGQAAEAGRPARFVAPHRRQVGIVPQEGALFPHLSVAANIGYALPRRSPGRDERITELLHLTGLEGLERRYPRQLSGGQQQRVAVARALAPRPGLILLDEPFAALDADTRRTVRRSIADILTREGATAILVTHDREEALSVAERTAVMLDGRVVQTGTPQEVYDRPTDRRVARLLGEATLLPVVARSADTVTCAVGELRVTNGDCSAPGAQVLLRPEQIRVTPRAASPGLDALVTHSEFHGADCRVGLALADGTHLLADVADVRPERGDRVTVSVSEPAHLVP